MKKLTRNDINELEQLMYAKALDLDVSLFNYDFNNMPAEYVLFAMSMYQNKDGGFGHGLDIDNYNTNSTAYQTYVALKNVYLAGYKNYKDNEELTDMLNHAFNYLYNRALPLDGLWNLRDKSNDGFACAERYRDHGEKKDYYPTAGILGYTLYLVSIDKVYYKKALKMAQKAVDSYLEMDSVTFDLLEGFEALRMAIEEKNISLEHKDEFINKFNNDKKNYVITLEIDNNNYQDILALYDSYTKDDEINHRIDEALDMIFETRAFHGLWEMTHEWGNNYPEYDTAQLKWVGAVSRQNLHYLKKFGRIED